MIKKVLVSLLIVVTVLVIIAFVMVSETDVFDEILMNETPMKLANQDICIDESCYEYDINYSEGGENLIDYTQTITDSETGEVTRTETFIPYYGADEFENEYEGYSKLYFGVTEVIKSDNTTEYRLSSFLYERIKYLGRFYVNVRDYSLMWGTMNEVSVSKVEDIDETVFYFEGTYTRGKYDDVDRVFFIENSFDESKVLGYIRIDDTSRSPRAFLELFDAKVIYENGVLTNGDTYEFYRLLDSIELKVLIDTGVEQIILNLKGNGSQPVAAAISEENKLLLLLHVEILDYFEVGTVDIYNGDNDVWITLYDDFVEENYNPFEEIHGLLNEKFYD